MSIYKIKTDEETQDHNVEYFFTGLRKIVDHGNPGFADSFHNRGDDQLGYYFTNERFEEILDDLDIQKSVKAFPGEFILQIRFSPIVLFKRWIFSVSNKDFLKVSERNQEFEKDFYVYFLDGEPIFQPLTTNIAHEKFLIYVYEKDDISDYLTTFKTSFKDDKKLVLFKDISRKKLSAIKIEQPLTPGRLYPVKVQVVKDEKAIKFKYQVNGGPIQNQAIRLSGTSGKSSASGKSGKASAQEKTITEGRKKLEAMLKEMNGHLKETNRYANISLGRVEKIPVLINLASKYKNLEVRLEFKKNEIHIYTNDGELIKEYRIHDTPKSNWLESKI